MSGGNVNQPPVNPSAPTQAPGQAPGAGDNAADFYRRAVQARPTGFAENPIGAMASAVDRIGRAATNMVAGKELEGRDGLAGGEERLKRATAALRANPQSLAAKQEQFKAALGLFKDMEGLAPNDPRKLAIANLLVQLGNGLGAAGLPAAAGGLDMRGLLRLAAQLTSRFGDAAGMQAAFQLEGMLASSLPGTSVEAMRVRDMLVQQLGLSPGAAKLLAANWAVRIARAGEVPAMDVSARTLVLDAAQQSPSLGVLARAYWHDTSMANPADKDGFVNAFLKIANQGGFAVLNRKYRDLKRMARQEVSTSRVVGGTSAVPGKASRDDEAAEMFAALAQFSREDGGAGLPDSVRPVVERFYAR